MIAIQSHGWVTTNSLMRSIMGDPVSCLALPRVALRSVRRVRLVPANRVEDGVGLGGVEEVLLLEVGEEETLWLPKHDDVVEIDLDALGILERRAELPR